MVLKPCAGPGPAWLGSARAMDPHPRSAKDFLYMFLGLAALEIDFSSYRTDFFLASRRDPFFGWSFFLAP